MLGSWAVVAPCSGERIGWSLYSLFWLCSHVVVLLQVPDSVLSLRFFHHASDGTTKILSTPPFLSFQNQRLATFVRMLFFSLGRLLERSLLLPTLSSSDAQPRWSSVDVWKGRASSKEALVARCGGSSSCYYCVCADPTHVFGRPHRSSPHARWHKSCCARS